MGILLFDIATDDDADVEDVQADEEERVRDTDAVSERDEERIHRRDEQEHDFEGDVPVDFDGVGEKAGALRDGGILRPFRPVYRVEGDSGPAETDENPIRTGHVRDGEVGVVTGPCERPRVPAGNRFCRQLLADLCRRPVRARVPRVVGVDGVLRCDGQNCQNRDCEATRNVFLGGFGTPREHERSADNGETGHSDDEEGRRVGQRIETSHDEPRKREGEDCADREQWSFLHVICNSALCQKTQDKPDSGVFTG